MDDEDKEVRERNQAFCEFTSFSTLPCENKFTSEESTENSFWTADFSEPFHANEFTSQNETVEIVRKNLKLSLRASEVLQESFSTTIHSSQILSDLCSLQNLYYQSSISGSLASQIFEPIDARKTLSVHFKNDSVKYLVNDTQVKERWLEAVDQATLGCFQLNLDYHRLTKKEGNGSGGNSSPSVNTISTELYIKEQLEDIVEVEPIRATCLLDDSVSIEHVEDVPREAAYQELWQKSVKELKEIIEELNIEVNVFSGILVTELDYREKLKRDQEMKNRFIASHLAVERKIKEQEKKKKKKSRYNFFKTLEDESKATRFTIPYIHQDGGPSSTDLALIIKILESIEMDDKSTPKLISDYVMKGDQYNLQTVIKVRTGNGFDTLNEDRMEQS